MKDQEMKDLEMVTGMKDQEMKDPEMETGMKDLERETGMERVMELQEATWPL